MKTKYVCRGLISLYVNFHNNRTMWLTNLHVKVCRWGREGKRAWKNASHTISIYEKILIIDLSYYFLYLWNCIKSV